MGLFTTHRITIKKNVIKTVGRQPVGSYEDLVDTDGNILVIPCRITRNDTANQTFLFILKKYYELIGGDLHKNYQISIEGITQTYVLVNEPLWGGGVRHHIEAVIQEMI